MDSVILESRAIDSFLENLETGRKVLEVYIDEKTLEKNIAFCFQNKGKEDTPVANSMLTSNFKLFPIIVYEAIKEYNKTFHARNLLLNSAGSEGDVIESDMVIPVFLKNNDSFIKFSTGIFPTHLKRMGEANFLLYLTFAFDKWCDMPKKYENGVNKIYIQDHIANTINEVLTKSEDIGVLLKFDHEKEKLVIEKQYLVPNFYWDHYNKYFTETAEEVQREMEHGKPYTKLDRDGREHQKTQNTYDVAAQTASQNQNQNNQKQKNTGKKKKGKRK